MSGQVFAAVDVGASGGRVMMGAVRDERVVLECLHRFPHTAREQDGHLRWDLTGIFGEIKTGLGLLPAATSIGIDTWGVDYGLLGDGGELLAPPVSYRDDRSAKAVDDVHAVVPFEDLYAVTGLQFLPFTTVYQLAAERQGSLLERAAHALLLPDLIAYWLTGELRTEVTNASTTGLLDARTRKWSTALTRQLGVRDDLFPPLEVPGVERGRTADGVPVTTVGSHDTASAVVGVPAMTRNFAYVSCGTWSLVGVELDGPVLSDAARAANFTNEAGVDGRTRFLRNVGGLWLLQECMRSWDRDDLDALLAAAARVPSGGPVFDVDDPSFIAPGDMPRRIVAATERADLGEAEIVRCIIDSLAIAFARTVRRAADLSGVDVEVVHVVGGGSQNELLCQLTADAVRLPVVAGPVESTALGNVAVQAAAAGALPSDLAAIRRCIAGSFELRRYEPR
jgi:rhamnulokinase